MPAQRAAAITGAVVLLALGAVAPASAAPEVISPVHATAAEAPGQAVTGFRPVASPGGVWGEILPAASTTTLLEALAPPLSSGFTVAPGFGGTVSMTSELTRPGPDAGSRLYANAGQPLNGVYSPPNDTFFGSTWLWNYWNGEWTYQLDFTDLEGGVLPAGTRLFAGDLDMVREEGEVATFTSSASGPWMSYDFEQVGNGYAYPVLPSVVFYDAEANAYSVRGQNPNVDMSNWFTTTADLTSLTVVLSHGANPNRGAILWGMQLPLVPIETGIALEKRVAAVADVNGNGVTDAGDTIAWEFDVTNTGNVPLTGVRIADDVLAAVEIGVTCDPTDLPVDGVVTCRADGAYTITTADALAGEVVNTAVAWGDPGDGTGEIDSEPSTTRTPVEVVPEPTSPEPTSPEPTSPEPTTPQPTSPEPSPTTPAPSQPSGTSVTSAAPSAAPSATATKPLASTGADVTGWGAAAGLAVVLGAGLVLAARHRSARS